MPNIKQFELPGGQAGLTTVFAIIKRRGDGYFLDDTDGVFRANPAKYDVAVAEDPVLPGVYHATESRSIFPDGTYACFFYDNQGGANNPATSSLLGKDERPVVNDLLIQPDTPSVPPSDLAAKVQGLVKDTDGKLDDSDWANGILGAISRYSKHRPKIAVADIAGDGTNLYAVPTAWVPEFSVVESIEYPADQDPEGILYSVPDEALDSGDDYAVVLTAAGDEKIKFFGYRPQATEIFRVKFTLPRAEETIAANDVDAVANLAASICLGMLASRYIGTGDSTIQADAVNYRTKSQEARSRAKDCREFYDAHIGIKADDSEPAASAVASLKTKYPGGMERLTHLRRSRDRR